MLPPIKTHHDEYKMLVLKEGRTLHKETRWKRLPRRPKFTVLRGKSSDQEAPFQPRRNTCNHSKQKEEESWQLEEAPHIQKEAEILKEQLDPKSQYHPQQ